MSSELSQSKTTHLTPDTWRASGDRSLLGQLNAGRKNLLRAISPEARKAQAIALSSKIDANAEKPVFNEGQVDIKKAIKVYAEAASMALQAEANPFIWREAKTEHKPANIYDTRRLQEPSGVRAELLNKITDIQNLHQLTRVYDEVLSTHIPNGTPNKVDIAERKVLIRLLPDVIKKLQIKYDSAQLDTEKRDVEAAKTRLEAQLAAVVSGQTTPDSYRDKNFNAEKISSRDYQETVELSMRVLFEVDDFKAGELLRTYLRNPDLTLEQKKNLLTEAPLTLTSVEAIIDEWSRSSGGPDKSLLYVVLDRVKKIGIIELGLHAKAKVSDGKFTNEADGFGYSKMSAIESDHRQIMLQNLLKMPLQGDRRNAQLILGIWADSFGDHKARTVSFDQLDITTMSPDVVAQLGRFADSLRKSTEYKRPGETVPNLNEKEKWALHDALQESLRSYGEYGVYAHFTPTDQERVLTILREIRKLRADFKNIPDERKYFGFTPFRDIGLSSTITRQRGSSATSKWYSQVEKNVIALNEDAKKRNEKVREAQRSRTA